MDEAQFSQRCIGCSRRLYVVAYAILGRDADCEDAVQEALLRAWARRGSLRDEKYFETWLTRILINEARRLLRARSRRPTMAPDERMPAPEPPDRTLHDALQALPPPERLLLTLHHAEGYSVEEAAAIAGLPLGAAKWRLRRGRAMLKALLEGGAPRE